jgi:O-glycosyl hydrolase
MPTALFVARIIHNDLTICNARSWQWWTAITESDYKDGLVYLDSGTAENPGEMGDHLESLKFDGTARDSKLMWALGNYSRFVRPGMKRIKADLISENNVEQTLRASAFFNPETRETVVVVVNAGNKEFSIDYPAISAKTGAKMYVTSSEKNLAFSELNQSRIRILPRSLTTICY